MVSFYVKCR